MSKQRGRPPALRDEGTKVVTIKLEVTDEELQLINAWTSPRTRALSLAEVARRIERVQNATSKQLGDYLASGGTLPNNEA